MRKIDSPRTLLEVNLEFLPYLSYFLYLKKLLCEDWEDNLRHDKINWKLKKHMFRINLKSSISIVRNCIVKSGDQNSAMEKLFSLLKHLQILERLFLAKFKFYQKKEKKDLNHFICYQVNKALMRTGYYWRKVSSRWQKMMQL